MFSLFHMTELALENAPAVAAEAFYKNWKQEHVDKPEEHQAQLEAARVIGDEGALDGVTVHQVRAQALNISKQITQLVSTHILLSAIY